MLYEKDQKFGTKQTFSLDTAQLRRKLSNATNNQIQSLSRRSVGASFSAVLNSASQKIQCM